MEKGNDSLITILTTSFQHEIHIARSLLASYGIHSYIMDENIDLVYGRSFIDGFKLQVNAQELDKAKDILKELDYE